MAVLHQEEAPANDLLTEPARKLNLTFAIGSLQDGGAERQVLELLRKIDRQHFDLSIMLMEDSGVERARSLVDKCFVMGLPQGGNSRWLRRSASLCNGAYRTTRQLIDWKTDILHAFLPGPSIIAGLAGRMAHVPVLIGSRRSLVSFYRKGRAGASLMDRVAFNIAHMNLGNSTAVSQEMIHGGGCPSKKCRTIYNGVDTDRFHPDLARIWSARMGWNETNVVFGMIANFRNCKRHVDFVRAAQLIVQRHPQARFVMVGADYGSRASVIKEIEGLGLRSYVYIVESTPTPEHIFAAIDVYVCTSEVEGFSNVVLEAMSCGKPVIATQVGGNPEAVLHEETGFLVPPGDPACMAEMAEQLITQAGLRVAMGRKGRKRIEDHFSLRKMIRLHEELYLSLWSEGTGMH
jgi:glycosyltransferase involved in cell wall biosynthesis